MTEHRARHAHASHAGRKSPIYNPARASMPVNIGYALPYTGEIHPIPTTARYDPTVPRRHDPKASAGPTTTAPTSANTTAAYSAPKEQVSRSLSRSNRNRSSTVDAHSGKPIIVTTNHARPQAPSSHATGSARASSPPREPYRTNEDTYYTAVQPASSIRSRSHNRHSYSQGGVPLSDELYRLRERVAGVNAIAVTGPGAIAEPGFWGPSRTSTDTFRNPRPHVLYPTSAHLTAHPATPTHHTAPSYPSSSAIAEYEDDYYEYTKPSELVRYDLDHDRDRKVRHDSVDRTYYRPHVNVANHDSGRYEPRNRIKPPPSAGLERYNRATTVATTGTYDRPTVTMPAPPAVPPPPPIETQRRPALLEAPKSPSVETRTAKPRPVSLYQDGPTRPSHADEPRRARDDERIGKDRRERDDAYRDDDVTARGFGIRSDAHEKRSGRGAQNQDERRSRHEATDRESKRGSDDSLPRVRPRARAQSVDYRRVEDVKDRKDSISRRESISRSRDKLTASLKGTAAAGLVPVFSRDEIKDSSRRRASDDDREPSSRATDRAKSRERGHAERRSPPREDRIVSEQRREPREERAESRPGSEDRDSRTSGDRQPRTEHKRDRDYDHAKERDRDYDHAKERDRDYDQAKERDRDYDQARERDRDYDHVKEREREREQEERDYREQQHREAEAKLNGSADDKREASPEDDSNVERRRRRPSSGFDPTDTKGLMDLKAELAALDDETKEPEKVDESDAPSTKESGKGIFQGVLEKIIGIPAAPTKAASESEKDDESVNESRGREIVPAREEKQVRVVSPPREKIEPKPIKGILKAPKVKFPEDSNPIREGVAPHKDDQTKKDVPAGARWTKISRKKVNPEALTIGKERFELRDDFVIVLRVLNKEEIQAYATATAQIRETRRKEFEKDSRHERHSDEEQTRSDEERQRRHRHRQEREEDEYRKGRAADDKHRRHRYDDEIESRPKTIEYNSAPHHRHHDSKVEDRR